MKKIFLIIFAWLCINAQAHGEWSKFVWAKSSIPGLKSKNGAIILSVELDGINCHMQLDTGVDSSILYRNALPKIYSTSVSQPTIKIKKFSFNSHIEKDSVFSLIYDQDADQLENPCLIDHNTPVAGSLGNDRFMGGHLSLDLRNNWFEYQDGAFRDPPSGTDDQVFGFELFNTDHGYLPILTLHYNDRVMKFLLDTGSAPAGLIMYKQADWVNLVESDLEQAEKFSSLRWNKPIEGYNSPIKKKILMGTWEIPPGTAATYINLPDEQVAKDNPIWGIIGLAIFENKIIVIDYFSKKLHVRSPAQSN